MANQLGTLLDSAVTGKDRSMYTLRCTKPLLKKLQHLTPPLVGDEPDPTTVLGDWYANRLNIGHQRLILCTNEPTLLSVVVSAKDLPGLPARLVTSLGKVLFRLGVPPAVGQAELQEMEEVRFGPTRNRSVLGVMTDAAREVRWKFESDGPMVPLDQVNLYLSEVPWSPLWDQRHLPRSAALELLGE